jgi:UDP-N-acetylmuramyl pentapeptide synthase
MTDTLEDFEDRIKTAKAKRDVLAQKRAEKAALLRAATEKLEKLKEKAEAKGFSLEELPDLIVEKKRILNGKIAVFETALQDVEDRLSKYDD